MGRIVETFKRVNYNLPSLLVGGSTRTDTVSTGGDVIVCISGSDTAQFVLTGTRLGSTAFYSEIFTVSANTSLSKQTATTDWTNLYGVVMVNSTASNPYYAGVSTESYDTTFYAASSSQTEVAAITSGNKSTKAVILPFTGHDVTFHDISGNLFANSVLYPTSNNSLKYTAGMVDDMNVKDYMMFESDTGGATIQVRVWE